MKGNASVAQPSDAAKRAADVINGLLAANDWDTARMGWIAIRLSDGGSDGVIYDSKKAAITHQIHEQQCAYVALRNLIAGATAKEMDAYLEWNRGAYRAGLRMPDPDEKNGGPDLLMPSRIADKYRNGVRYER